MRRFGVLIASLCLVVSSRAACTASRVAGCRRTFGRWRLRRSRTRRRLRTFPKSCTTRCGRSFRSGSGVRDAPKDRADALAHGTILSYDADVPVSFSANPQQAVTARRRLQLTIEVEIIDQSNGHVLFQNKSMREEADYAERAEARRSKAGDRETRAEDHRRSAKQLVNQRRGASALGCLFSLLIVGALVYFGLNVGRVYWRFYQFQDDMRQEVRFASSAFE